jgi:hypothetical protein
MNDAELHTALRGVVTVGRRGGYSDDEIAEQLGRVVNDYASDRTAAFVEVVQGGYMKGCARVEGTCPACGARTLALGAGCRVTCASASCPDPSAVDDYLDPRAEVETHAPCKCGHHRSSHSGGLVLLGKCWASDCACEGDVL